MVDSIFNTLITFLAAIVLSLFNGNTDLHPFDAKRKEDLSFIGLYSYMDAE